MGGCCLFVQGGKVSNAKKTIKYVLDLDGHVMIFQTQQPTKNMQAQSSGYIGAGATKGERAGGMKPSFWGALEVVRR
jgi:hypothetical protein